MSRAEVLAALIRADVIGRTTAGPCILEADRPEEHQGQRFAFTGQREPFCGACVLDSIATAYPGDHDIAPHLVEACCKVRT